MCSVIILLRPGHDWPVLIASNRDEMIDRPWLAPARHWPDRPEVVAGKDELAGGSWLGLNETGLVVGMLNRRNTLGPQSGKRSRGELVLDALDFADGADAVGMLQELDPAAYRPFNMVVVDNRDTFWLRNLGDRIEAERLSPGLSMITASDRNDRNSTRIRHYLPLWESADVPAPERQDWAAWTALLGSRQGAPGSNVFDAMNIVSNTGFGTVSSSLIALPSVAFQDRKPIWRFCAGHPDKGTWVDVDL
ncbi:MAG TPA: NRDE family protein [Dongiaceae bacterium]